MCDENCNALIDDLQLKHVRIAKDHDRFDHRVPPIQQSDYQSLREGCRDELALGGFDLVPGEVLIVQTVVGVRDTTTLKKVATNFREDVWPVIDDSKRGERVNVL